MRGKNGNPGAGGAGASKVRSPKQQNTKKVARNAVWLEATWLPNQQPCRFTGREAQTLNELIHAGAAGLTSGDFSSYAWARRTSAYVHKLRVRLHISTNYEVVPPDATVGRYRLQTPVVVVARHGLI
jgi:hypothetical protein